MLVLSRKTKEGIVIGKDIYITILSIERGRVKIGISAPSDVKVDRAELLNKDQKESVPEQGNKAEENTS